MSEYTILLASADKRLSNSLQHSVNRMDARLVWVENAREACSYMTTLPVALLVADQELPGTTGVALLQEAMALAPFAIRILAVESGTDPEIHMKALNTARVSFFLRKPESEILEVQDILVQALAGYETEVQGREAVETLHQSMIDRASGIDSRALKLRRLCTAGEMAGSLIHKFNNTLTLIMGHLEMLLSDVKGADIISRLNPIFQSAADSAGMARRLQEFMRTTPSETESIDLNQLINDTLKMTEPVWKSSSRGQAGVINMDTNLAELDQVTCNPSEIREALTNLVLNAVDAMPRGGDLSISSVEMTDWVRIEVQDTGEGVLDHVKDRIFEPFFTTKGEDGNGLGLSIVRRIVEEHGGDIRIESRPGKGTKFILLLPSEDQRQNGPSSSTATKIQVAG